MEPDLPNVQLVSRIAVVQGACNDWRRALKVEFDENGLVATVVISGNFPSECGEKTWPLALLDGPRYSEAAWRWVWSEAGGILRGKVRPGETPAEARLVYSHESEPLATLVRDTNKFSNNVMARHLFLALSAEPRGQVRISAPFDLHAHLSSVLAKFMGAYPRINVELRLSTYVGRDVTLKQLHDEYDAVLVTAGCFEPNYPAEIKNLDADGVMAGIVFLERAYRGRPVEVGKNVVVLGGGYTAMDCASTSWRLGADSVVIAYRRSRDEMVVRFGPSAKAAGPKQAPATGAAETRVIGGKTYVKGPAGWTLKK
jgi:hypothetical protein